MRCCTNEMNSAYLWRSVASPRVFPREGSFPAPSSNMALNRAFFLSPGVSLRRNSPLASERELMNCIH